MNNHIHLLNHFGNLIRKYPEHHYWISQIGTLAIKYPEKIDQIADCFSFGQIESKLWLIKELLNVTDDLGTVFTLAGWYGSLGGLLLADKRFRIIKVRSFDMDQSCADLADTMNRTPWVKDSWRFKASTANIVDFDYDITTYKTLRADNSEVELQDIPNTIINTSCEHIEPFDLWINLLPARQLLVLQSNNYYDGDGHVNCAANLAQFKSQCQLREVMFEGELKLDKYTRFMLIGRR
ncbi:MAG: hypothetical protein HN730_00310 [Bdellovibrionales bacterium]|jgi:hypothetical protein|nr:hypothetical protein [Bdellovibrionales bacterium]